MHSIQPMTSRSDGLCAIDGCGRRKDPKHPFCYGHQKRFYRTGVIGGCLRSHVRHGGIVCVVAGCESRAIINGLCRRHYQASRIGRVEATTNGVICRESKNEPSWREDSAVFGESWCRWSIAATSRLRSRVNNAKKDEWRKWCERKVSKTRAGLPRDRSKSTDTTWESKYRQWTQALLKLRWRSSNKDAWIRWIAKKVDHVRGRQANNIKTA